MINFSVGPVQMNEDIANLGSKQIPYFRTADFSKLMKENEELILSYSFAPKNSRAVFITGSGTASMEAAIINVLCQDDKVLLVDGGSFGERFAKILVINDIAFEEIKLQSGHCLKEEDLMPFDNKGFSAFVVNIHETSTGVLYDLNKIGEFCKKNNMLLIVDAISSFLADEINMEKSSIDVLITGSQKALACPPGISLLVLSPRALELIQKNNPKCFYLDLKSALVNGERGQTPFTPAVSILIQINKRLKQIQENGGVFSEIQKTKELAQYFRSRLGTLPLVIASDSLSNAVTPLHPLNVSANDVFLTLMNDYGIWVCPNGGELKDKLFRVGHIGDLKKEDYDTLIAAFEDMHKKGLL